MKDLLSKEHYCYKIQKLLMKSSAYRLFYGHLSPLYGLQLPNLDKPSMIFQKSQPPINKGVHTMNIPYDPLKQS